jgi:hypothetical protein
MATKSPEPTGAPTGNRVGCVFCEHYDSWTDTGGIWHTAGLAASVAAETLDPADRLPVRRQGRQERPPSRWWLTVTVLPNRNCSGIRRSGTRRGDDWWMDSRCAGGRRGRHTLMLPPPEEALVHGLTWMRGQGQSYHDDDGTVHLAGRLRSRRPGPGSRHRRTHGQPIPVRGGQPGSLF